MIIVMHPGASREQIEKVEARLVSYGFKTHPIFGEQKTVIGAVGDKKIINAETIAHLPGVEKVVPIRTPYKLASHILKSEKTTISLNGYCIGGPQIVVFAGPCAVESEEQLLTTALAVKQAGAHVLRAGAFKPRTSPYSFQGLEEKGLKMLAQARAETGLPIITEVLDPRDVPLVANYADILQVGARNMQNFRLLQETGQAGKPVLLKRGLAATIEEWLMAAEYIMDAGNEQIILCERGIRTFEPSTRNTLDLSAIPLVKEKSHLPVIVDPSHGTGSAKLVPAMAKAAIAAGADGLIIEVHPDPDHALCDGPQSLAPEAFNLLMQELKTIAGAIGRSC
jgi:3-deoxy-7-phosphoheptulonate synthase